MELRKINLQNFRQFKNTTVEFSTDVNKNVTVILGDNTFGKTTFVKAFIWCLYRQNTFKDNKILLNHDVQVQMRPGESKETKVVLTLMHNGFDYLITTREEYTKSQNGNITTSKRAQSSMLKGCTGNPENMKPIPPDAVSNEINNILREELKDYFFFDGEDNSIEKISMRGNLKDAVSNLLGLQRLEDFANYFSPNIDSVRTRIADGLEKKDDGVTTLLNDDLLRNKGECQKAKDQVKKAEEEIDKLSKELQDKNDIISANKGVMNQQEEKKEKLDDNIKLKEAIENDFSNTVLSVNTTDVLLRSLYAASFNKYDLLNKLSSSSYKSETSLTHISTSAVDDIIKRGYCICGAKIESGNEAYKHLIESKEHMEPNDYGKYASDFSDSEHYNFRNSKVDLYTLSNNLTGILEKIGNVDQNNKRIKDITNLIVGCPEIGEIQQRANDISAEIAKQENYRDFYLYTNIPELEKKIQKNNADISAASVNNEKNNQIKNSLKYCDYIYLAASSQLQVSKNKVRNNLQDEVTKAFNKMYSGKRIIRIDEDFRVSTKLQGFENENIDDSGGLSAVTNFAFVAGLISLAKSKMTLSIDFSDNTPIDENYPLIMDAPFSKTDEKHIKNVCSILPIYCNQLIIAIMNKDYQEAEPALNVRVGKIYRFIKKSETESDIEAI